MLWHLLLLVPVVLAGFYWLAATACLAIFIRRGRKDRADSAPAPYLPFVSLLKPVYGLEKGLESNLKSACHQEYPEYEVVFGIQRTNDPALRVVQSVAADSPLGNSLIVVDDSTCGNNGKVNNLLHIIKVAKGEVLVFSDSDMRLAPDYLRTIVAPLADETTGISCTLYRAEGPENIFEIFELLSYNAEFVVSIVFATLTGASIACPGATLAIRREVLEEVGGLAPFCDDLVEDYALAKRVVEKGYRVRFVPYAAGMRLDLASVADWWRHQVGWDLKTRVASPSGHFFTLLIRGIPFALLYAATGGPRGWTVLFLAAGLRILTGAVNARHLGDRDGLRCMWLLPVRDLLALAVWLASLVKRDTSWRGRTFTVKHGKMVEEQL